LCRPDAYPEHPERVEAVETHMSWVFLTDPYAYKLKKPVRYAFLDFSTIEARRRDCEEELRLNRRLAPEVYLGVVPLTIDIQGALQLNGPGKPVDWLVQMRRLPAEHMLDNRIRHHTVTVEQVRAIGRVLARFYQASPPLEIAPAEYRQRFEEDIRSNLAELSRPVFGLPIDLVTRVSTAQWALLEREPGLLDARLHAGWVIEAHGDLRPEHICVGEGGEHPLIIDCLEFKREFRILDTADELAFLAMECERLGSPWVGPVLFDTYGRETGDRPPERLLRFYRSYRASLRAKLAIWHLQDPSVQDPRPWSRLAHDYLRLAEEHLPL
jgi:aminoglycoside phosphotransferase family enzyme